MSRCAGLGLLLVAGCNPVLTPVVGLQAQEVAGETRAPRVVWVLDRSGSLLAPVDVTAPACPVGCGLANPCPAACPTRKSMLDQGLATLAAQLPPARHGAVLYPTDATCGAPATFDVSVPPGELGDSMSQVLTRYAAATPLGGTPTRLALQFVASSLLPEPETDTFVVLVTDGLPNCNAANPNNECAAPAAACRCTTSSCSGSLCSLGCLDDLGTIDASRELGRKGALLVVLGVGPEVEGSAVLSSLDMALPRLCATSADCRAGTSCEASGACAERFFAVTAPEDFASPTKRIVEAVSRSTRCTWWLEREVVATDLMVSLNGVALPAGAWTLEGARRVRLSAQACASLLATDHPTFLWRPGSSP